MIKFTLLSADSNLWSLFEVHRHGSVIVLLDLEDLKEAVDRLSI
jgi:hypothetical protein